MTIYEFLKNDHKEVKKLFKQATKLLPDHPEKALSIFNTIKIELVSHAKAEEDVFYVPLLKMASDKKSQLITLEGKSEHHVVSLLIKEIDQLDCNNPEWGAKLIVLSELVDHHIEEEESDIFEKARSVFTLEEAKLMAIGMAQLKNQYKKQIDLLLIKEVDLLLKDQESSDQDRSFISYF